MEKEPKLIFIQQRMKDEKIFYHGRSKYKFKNKILMEQVEQAWFKNYISFNHLLDTVPFIMPETQNAKEFWNEPTR